MRAAARWRHSLGRSPARGGDMGMVTAESAVVLPLLVVVTLALVWALFAAAAQVRCVDAAGAGARAAARQDPEARAVATARGVAPEGAEVRVEREGDLVRVTVTAEAPGPGGLGVRLGSSAVALAEETVGTGEVAS
ncbi:TadE family type IV pilus minor pilin [Streptomyces sp. NPDC004959]|uniref:TadE family type IV pilus minor pilin n=1 Tax=unclassified Streptomyces TaxID=2593676 RepID=UPI0004CA4BE5|nr:TadE family type IV pilus minor pilin [Streptomyces sp. NRRL F-5630]